MYLYTALPTLQLEREKNAIEREKNTLRQNLREIEQKGELRGSQRRAEEATSYLPHLRALPRWQQQRVGPLHIYETVRYRCMLARVGPHSVRRPSLRKASRIFETNSSSRCSLISEPLPRTAAAQLLVVMGTRAPISSERHSFVARAWDGLLGVQRK